MSRVTRSQTRALREVPPNTLHNRSERQRTHAASGGSKTCKEDSSHAMTTTSDGNEESAHHKQKEHSPNSNHEAPTQALQQVHSAEIRAKDQAESTECNAEEPVQEVDERDSDGDEDGKPYDECRREDVCADSAKCNAEAPTQALQQVDSVERRADDQADSAECNAEEPLQEEEERDGDEDGKPYDECSWEYVCTDSEELCSGENCDASCGDESLEVESVSGLEEASCSGFEAEHSKVIDVTRGDDVSKVLDVTEESDVATVGNNDECQGEGLFQRSKIMISADCRTSREASLRGAHRLEKDSFSFPGSCATKWYCVEKVTRIPEQDSSSNLEGSDELGLRCTRVVNGTIPDILRWTIHQLQESSVSYGKLTLPASPAIATGCSVTFWNGGKRFWDNVSRFASMLPIPGRFENILYAMERYPSSVLVHTGFRPLFDKYRKLGATPICRLLPSPNAFSEFCSSKNNSTAKDWYEDDCHTRLQEIAVHLTAVAEYVLRCAYISLRYSDINDAFMNLVTTRIALIGTDDDPHFVLKSSKGLLWDLSEEEAYTCLRLAMRSAHDAVLCGSAISGRKHGKKRQSSVGRQRVKLKQLHAIPTEVVNLLIENLSHSSTEVIGAGKGAHELDIDEFEFRMKKVLRGAGDLYKRVGMKFFKKVFEFQ